MEPQTYKSANRRYRRDFIITVALYIALCCATPFIIAAIGAEHTAWVAFWALLNGVPVGLILWLMLRLNRETDEYTRLKQLEAIAEGAAITVTLSTIVGFLELYRVIDTQWTFWVGPGFFIAYGFAAWRRALPKIFWA